MSDKLSVRLNPSQALDESLEYDMTSKEGQVTFNLKSSTTLKLDEDGKLEDLENDVNSEFDDIDPEVAVVYYDINTDSIVVEGSSAKDMTPIVARVMKFASDYKV